MTSLIDLGVKKDLFKFFSTVFNKWKNEFLQQLKIPTDMYILKNCLFVLRDMNVTLNNLRNMGYIVDKGPKTCRDPLNSRSSFLNCVDEQYRTCLYNLHLKFANTGNLSPCLSRFKFHLEI